MADRGNGVIHRVRKRPTVEANETYYSCKLN